MPTQSPFEGTKTPEIWTVTKDSSERVEFEAVIILKYGFGSGHWVKILRFNIRNSDIAVWLINSEVEFITIFDKE